MKDIKFRAWDKLINKMITESNVKEIIDTIQGDFNTTYVYDSDEWYPAYEIFGIFNYFQAIKEMRIDRYNEKSELRFELMQYTGLHDKNGKEIYEGDIVRKFNGIIGKVIYEHSEFIIDVTNNKELDYGRLDLIENLVEVIGNIYDNPDLLEKGAEE